MTRFLAGAALGFLLCYAIAALAWAPRWQREIDLANEETRYMYYYADSLESVTDSLKMAAYQEQECER